MKIDKWQAVFTDPQTGVIDAILYADTEMMANAKASAYRSLNFCRGSIPEVSEVPKPQKPASKPAK